MSFEMGILTVYLYFGSALFVVLIVLVSLWRSMKAQEAMAKSLEKIERVIAESRK